MQQLNVLPINVSKGVEAKDESVTLSSTPSKSEFSQHIDTQLAKNRDVGHNDKRVVDEKLDANTIKTFHEHSGVKAKDKTPDSVDAPLTSTDKADLANDAQDIAASGKEVEKLVSQEKPIESERVADESELLMSFLIKADKTLINKGVNENVNFDEMSAEQKTKHEAQLLLKSSDLVADLSKVAKAVQPNSNLELDEATEATQIAKALQPTSKENKDNSQLDASKLLETKNSLKGSVDKLNTEILIDERRLQESTLAIGISDKSNASAENKAANSELSQNDKNLLSQQQSSLSKLVSDNGKAEIVDENKNKNKNNDLMVKNEFAGTISSQKEVSKESLTQKDLGQKELSQKEFSQQSFVENNKTLATTDTALAKNAKALTSNQNTLLDKIKMGDDVSALAQSQNTFEKQRTGLAEAISNSQNTANSKNLAGSNLGQVSTATEVKASDAIKSEAQINAKSVDHLIEQSKEFSVEDSKDINNKILPKTNTAFSINNSFSEMTGRATQASQDIVEQHAADVFNPIGSSEVSQSQKTNTQLHQETISIFRRDFADAVKDKVMLMISQKLQQFDITLDPPELGNMHVRVNLQGDQATVNFVVQNQQAKDAFEQNMHKLKDMLAEQGVDVGDASVEQQSQQSDNENSNGEDSSHHSMTNTADASDAIEHNLSASAFNNSATAVDYYA